MMKKLTNQENKKRIFAMLLSGTLAFGLVTGCGKASEPEPKAVGGQSHVGTGIENPNQDITVDPDVAKLISGNCSQMGYEIYQDLYTIGENSCISPCSIYTAMAMLSNAAEEETLAELLGLLGCDSKEQLQELNQFMSSNIQRQDVSTANSVWYDENRVYSEEFRGEYLPFLSEYYSAKGYEADFSDPETVNDINGWVSDATHKKITQIINEIDPDDNMMLLNAIYFKGDWKIPFDEKNTYDSTFYGGYVEEEVPMMHIYDEEFAYYHDHGMEILRMEYEDSNLVMDILIADEEYSSDLRKTESGEYVVECYDYRDATWDRYRALTEKEWADLEEGIANADKITINTFALPKFEYASDIMSLKETLRQMGVVQAFSGNAQLDKISELTYVDDVLHKTYIKVDETGTEAAAVTAVITQDNAVMITEYQNFIVDRPFMYIIRDSETGMIYFMGNMSHIN